MPLIEFVCRLGHRTEKILTTTEAETTHTIFCPQCFATNCRRTAKRVISLPAAPQFKGDGWTPTFHKPGESQIGGVPVQKGDDPKEVAKKVMATNGGAARVAGAVKGAQ